eukprot:365503-Chlamydomonas_euryale.AAC.2
MVFKGGGAAGRTRRHTYAPAPCTPMQCRRRQPEQRHRARHLKRRIQLVPQAKARLVQQKLLGEGRGGVWGLLIAGVGEAADARSEATTWTGTG